MTSARNIAGAGAGTKVSPSWSIGKTNNHLSSAPPLLPPESLLWDSDNSID
eukprot:CAMPEP_0197444326 /NCGR_PEP_ID=MMETSP1175-20131217/9841_1 /TAXON_ID=1003142 /ORGANISM="Triceratium dubium, Strain CCMP147" /LENGTH=50 /DNA_ID=CAMNT_0042975099 /DNA_START=105 /DNA_END=254 /DNA_ORIENTATION=+